MPEGGSVVSVEFCDSSGTNLLEKQTDFGAYGKNDKSGAISLAQLSGRGSALRDGVSMKVLKFAG